MLKLARTWARTLGVVLVLPLAASAQQADSRITQTMKTLMTHYDAERGTWITEGWWNAANTTTVLASIEGTRPSADVADTLQTTFHNAPKRFPLFQNDFYDDEGWWALAWIQAYDSTHRKEYLDMAESIFADMTTGWDNTCSGGIWWKKNHEYKNAIANELFLSVAAHLALREPPQKRGPYLAWAKKEWDWFDHSGMINADNLINDGLTAACTNNGRNTWTYNQGVVVGGLVELSVAVGKPELRQRATSIAHAAMAKLADADGVLHDKSEPNCTGDTVQFKGIFMRNLALLQSNAPDPAVALFLRTNADSLWANARTEDNEFACRWSGPAKADGAAAATSALDALIADAASK